MCGVALAIFLSGVSSARADPRISHVAVIVMENHEYSSIIGSPSAPYINALAQSKVLLTASYAITHPSLPNYLALTGGATFGIVSNCTKCSVRGTNTNLVDEFVGRSVSWRAYTQTMPSTCYKGAVWGRHPNRYLKILNPFIHYADIASNPRRCGHIVQYKQLAVDLANDALPAFAWITPNLCSDMHDCTVMAGDQWLAAVVPSILAHLGTNGILIITWDEGKSTAGCCQVPAGGHIPTIIAGPGAANQTVISTPVDHYSLLQLMQTSLDVPLLRNATTAPAIDGWACRPRHARESRFQLSTGL